MLRGNAVVAERGVTLDDVAADAEPLVADGVPGADELAAVIDEARARRDEALTDRRPRRTLPISYGTDR